MGVHPAGRVVAQKAGPRVGTRALVDGNAKAARDEADDIVPRQRVAALCKFDQAVVQPFHNNALAGFLLFDGDLKHLGRALFLEQLRVFVLDLYHQAGELDAAVADGRVQLFRRVQALAARKVSHKFVVLFLRDGDEVAAHLLVQSCLALGDVFFLAFLFEPVADLVLGLAGGNQVQPVAAGPLILGAGYDLDDLARHHLVVYGHNSAVHLRAHHAVAHG